MSLCRGPARWARESLVAYCGPVWMSACEPGPLPGGPRLADGAHLAGTAAEAVAGVDAVVTMLWDGNSVAEVI